eukprot:GILI01000227.1.p1 GENE.GILI01000227.1~~GILI01000227.1.p1  ORF type:complete len:169 (-),score=24.35 GILI01000227.1:192-698(-)
MPFHRHHKHNNGTLVTKNTSEQALVDPNGGATSRAVTTIDHAGGGQMTTTRDPTLNQAVMYDDGHGNAVLPMASNNSTPAQIQNYPSHAGRQSGHNTVTYIPVPLNNPVQQTADPYGYGTRETTVTTERIEKVKEHGTWGSMGKSNTPKVYNHDTKERVHNDKHGFHH